MTASAPAIPSALSMERVSVRILGDTSALVVDDVGLTVERGEIVALVGESGSGKSTAALAALGHVRRGLTFATGQVMVNGSAFTERGRVVTYVPQDPAAALDPARRVGPQLREMLDAHAPGELDTAARDRRITQVLGEVELPDTVEFRRRFPHELSGGQQQRVCLAIAFVCRPAVVVLDEPTTGLDAATQGRIVDLIRKMCSVHGTAALYVSHDLAVVSTVAERVAVMYAGRIVEEGPTAAVLAAPAHPYTQHLVAATPDLSGRPIVGLPGAAPPPGQRSDGCAFADRCSLAHDACAAALPALRPIATERSVRCVNPFGTAVPAPAAPESTVRIARRISDRPSALEVRSLTAAFGGVAVVRDVSLDIQRGECLALVGESGSGKTTFARSIAGLHHEWTGEVRLGDVEGGSALATRARKRSIEHRLAVQYVFQNPYGSLNPRRTVGASIGRPLVVTGATKGHVREAVAAALDRVALSPTVAARFPGELSGGERQRAAIARALVCRPRLLLCDEVTSSLDVLAQANIVDLLDELRRDLDLAVLFISHDRALVATTATRVVVLSAGRLVEL